MQRNIHPWTELFESPEELRILADLQARQWQPDACYSSLKELLHPLVHSLHFNSHSRWGLQIDSQEIRTLSLGFLDWMKRSGTWENLRRDFSAKAGARPSLKLRLSRDFARYRQDTGLAADGENEPSYSARRSLLELPQPESALAPSVGDALMGAFNSISSGLPPRLRLPYQMHLEGLVNEEIAPLLGLEVKQLGALIKEAKAYMKDPNSWKNAS